MCLLYFHLNFGITNLITEEKAVLILIFLHLIPFTDVDEIVLAKLKASVDVNLIASELPDKFHSNDYWCL